MSANKHTGGWCLHVYFYIIMLHMLIHVCNGKHVRTVSQPLDQTSRIPLTQAVQRTSAGTSRVSLPEQNNFGTERKPQKPQRSEQNELGKRHNPDIKSMVYNGPKQEKPTTEIAGNNSGRKSLVEPTDPNVLRPSSNTAAIPDWYNVIFNTLPSAQTQPIQNIQNTSVDKSSSTQQRKSKQTPADNMEHVPQGFPTSTFHIHKPAVSVDTPTGNNDPPPFIRLDKIELRSQGNGFSNLISQSSKQQVVPAPLTTARMKESDLQIFNAKPSNPINQQIQRLSPTENPVTFNVETGTEQTLLNTQQFQMLSSSKLPGNDGLRKTFHQSLDQPQVGVNSKADIQQVFNQFIGSIPHSAIQRQSSSLPGEPVNNVKPSPRSPASSIPSEHFQSPSLGAEQTQTVSNRGLVSTKNSSHIPKRQSTNYLPHVTSSSPVQKTLQGLKSVGKQEAAKVKTSPGTNTFPPSNINSHAFESRLSKQLRSTAASDSHTGQSGIGLTTSQQQQQKLITTPFVRYDPAGKSVAFNVETTSMTKTSPHFPMQVPPLSGNERRNSIGSNPFQSNRNVFESSVAQNRPSSVTSESRASQSRKGLTSALVESSSGHQHGHHQTSSIQRYTPSGQAITFNVETNGFQPTVPETQKYTNAKQVINPSTLDRATFKSMPAAMNGQQSKGLTNQRHTGSNIHNIATKPGNIPNRLQPNNKQIHTENEKRNSIQRQKVENSHAQYNSMLTEMALKQLKAELTQQQNLMIPNRAKSASMHNEVLRSTYLKEPVQYRNHKQPSGSIKNNDALSSHVDVTMSEKLDTLHTIIHLIIDELRNPGMTFRSEHKTVHTSEKPISGESKQVSKRHTLNHQPPNRNSERQQHMIHMTEDKLKMSQTSHSKSSPPMEYQTYHQQTEPVQPHNEHALDSSWLHPMTIETIKARRPKHRQQHVMQKN